MSRQDISEILDKLEYKTHRSSIFDDYRDSLEYIELVKLCDQNTEILSHIVKYYWKSISWAGIDLICKITNIELKWNSDNMADPDSLLDQLKIRLRNNKLNKL